MAAVGQRGGVIEQTLTLSAPRPGLGQSGRARMPEFHGRFEDLGERKLVWGTEHLGTGQCVER